MKKFVCQMKELYFRQLPAIHPQNYSEYFPPQLKSCTHVYVRVDRIRKALEAPYSGPYQILDRFDRCFKLLMPNGKSDMVSISRLKPAVLTVTQPAKLAEKEKIPTSEEEETQ